MDNRAFMLTLGLHYNIINICSTGLLRLDLLKSCLPQIPVTWEILEQNKYSAIMNNVLVSINAYEFRLKIGRFGDSEKNGKYLGLWIRHE